VPRKPIERAIQPSLIDRLIDREPENRTEATDARNQSLQELKNSVRRDLEWLLNSRRTPIEPPPSAKELWRSVYSFGLPDFTGVALTKGEDLNQLARIVETAVTTFEPRLLNVTVSVRPLEENSHTLRFQIDALMRTEPAPARVSFDTTLELTKGKYEVAGEARAR
jgi:type VI secretion system protein ImpF